MSVDVCTYVLVPQGWSREVEENSVWYISPDQTPLKTRDELLRYLTSSGTCKCGLRCPFQLDSQFNFDPNIISLPDQTEVVSQCKFTNTPHFSHVNENGIFSPPVGASRGRSFGDTVSSNDNDTATYSSSWRSVSVTCDVVERNIGVCREEGGDVETTLSSSSVDNDRVTFFDQSTITEHLKSSVNHSLHNSNMDPNTGNEISGNRASSVDSEFIQPESKTIRAPLNLSTQHSSTNSHVCSMEDPDEGINRSKTSSVAVETIQSSIPTSADVGTVGSSVPTVLVDSHGDPFPSLSVEESFTKSHQGLVSLLKSVLNLPNVVKDNSSSRDRIKKHFPDANNSAENTTPPPVKKVSPSADEPFQSVISNDESKPLLFSGTSNVSDQVQSFEENSENCSILKSVITHEPLTSVLEENKAVIPSCKDSSDCLQSAAESKVVVPSCKESSNCLQSAAISKPHPHTNESSEFNRHDQNCLQDHTTPLCCEHPLGENSTFDCQLQIVAEPSTKMSEIKAISQKDLKDGICSPAQPKLTSQQLCLSIEKDVLSQKDAYKDDSCLLDVQTPLSVSGLQSLHVLAETDIRDQNGVDDINSIPFCPTDTQNTLPEKSFLSSDIPSQETAVGSENRVPKLTKSIPLRDVEVKMASCISKKISPSPSKEPDVSSANPEKSPPVSKIIKDIPLKKFRISLRDCSLSPLKNFISPLKRSLDSSSPPARKLRCFRSRTIDYAGLKAIKLLADVDTGNSEGNHGACSSVEMNLGKPCKQLSSDLRHVSHGREDVQDGRSLSDDGSLSDSASQVTSKSKSQASCDCNGTSDGTERLCNVKGFSSSAPPIPATPIPADYSAPCDNEDFAPLSWANGFDGSLSKIKGVCGKLLHSDKDDHVRPLLSVDMSHVTDDVCHVTEHVNDHVSHVTEHVRDDVCHGTEHVSDDVSHVTEHVRDDKSHVRDYEGNSKFNSSVDVSTLSNLPHVNPLSDVSTDILTIPKAQQVNSLDLNSIPLNESQALWNANEICPGSMSVESCTRTELIDKPVQIRNQICYKENLTFNKQDLDSFPNSDQRPSEFDSQGLDVKNREFKLEPERLQKNVMCAELEQPQHGNEFDIDSRILNVNELKLDPELNHFQNVEGSGSDSKPGQENGFGSKQTAASKKLHEGVKETGMICDHVINMDDQSSAVAEAPEHTTANSHLNTTNSANSDLTPDLTPVNATDLDLTPTNATKFDLTPASATDLDLAPVNAMEFDLTPNNDLTTANATDLDLTPNNDLTPANATELDLTLTNDHATDFNLTPANTTSTNDSNVPELNLTLGNTANQNVCENSSFKELSKVGVLDTLNEDEKCMAHVKENLKNGGIMKLNSPNSGLESNGMECNPMESDEKKLDSSESLDSVKLDTLNNWNGIECDGEKKPNISISHQLDPGMPHATTTPFSTCEISQHMSSSHSAPSPNLDSTSSSPCHSLQLHQHCDTNSATIQGSEQCPSESKKSLKFEPSKDEASNGEVTMETSSINADNASGTEDNKVMNEERFGVNSSCDDTSKNDMFCKESIDNSPPNNLDFSINRAEVCTKKQRLVDGSVSCSTNIDELTETNKSVTSCKLPRKTKYKKRRPPYIPSKYYPIRSRKNTSLYVQEPQDTSEPGKAGETWYVEKFSHNLSSFVPGNKMVEDDDIDTALENLYADESDCQLLVSIPLRIGRKRIVNHTVFVCNVDSVPEMQSAVEFKVGEVIWAKGHMLPAWPGKIISPTGRGLEKPTDDKVWVEWFGESTVSLVCKSSIKSLKEGVNRRRKQKPIQPELKVAIKLAIQEASEQKMKYKRRHH